MNTVTYHAIDGVDIFQMAIERLRDGHKPKPYCAACPEWCARCATAEARWPLEKKYPPRSVFENDALLQMCGMTVSNRGNQSTRDGSIKVLEEAIAEWNA